MSDWSRTVLHLAGGPSMPCRRAAELGAVRPHATRAPAVALDELDAVLARATALMGSAPDEARALLDGITLALPTAPPEDPFSDAYREWTWELYRTISGRAAYDTAHEASPFDLEAARRAALPLPDRLAGAGRSRPGRQGPAPKSPPHCGAK